MLKNMVIGLPEENLMLMKVMSGNGLSSVDYETESDRDLNYNDADILTNKQMDQILNAESDTEFAGFE